MLSEPRRKQHRVDAACGYALGAYLGVTLFWLSVMLSPGFALFTLLIAAVAGFFGTLRTIFGMPMRFWIIPLASLIFVKAVLLSLVYNAETVMLGVGVVFSAAFGYPVYRLFKQDFAKTIPPWLCKGCGYPLLGLTEPSCPECGERFDPADVPKLAETEAPQDDRLQ